jgi:hypothetical protein
VDLHEKQSFCEPLKLATEYGDLLMSLCYVPNVRLTVMVLKAWDLRSMDINLKSGEEDGYKATKFYPHLLSFNILSSVIFTLSFICS